MAFARPPSTVLLNGDSSPKEDFYSRASRSRSRSREPQRRCSGVWDENSKKLSWEEEDCHEEEKELEPGDLLKRFLVTERSPERSEDARSMVKTELPAEEDVEADEDVEAEKQTGWQDEDEAQGKGHEATAMAGFSSGGTLATGKDFSRFGGVASGSFAPSASDEETGFRNNVKAEQDSDSEDEDAPGRFMQVLSPKIPLPKKMPRPAESSATPLRPSAAPYLKKPSSAGTGGSFRSAFAPMSGGINLNLHGSNGNINNINSIHGNNNFTSSGINNHISNNNINITNINNNFSTNFNCSSAGSYPSQFDFGLDFGLKALHKPSSIRRPEEAAGFSGGFGGGFVGSTSGGSSSSGSRGTHIHIHVHSGGSTSHKGVSVPLGGTASQLPGVTSTGVRPAPPPMSAFRDSRRS
ncbi:unnamed protein product, partial [Polarella glacialis]